MHISLVVIIFALSLGAWAKPADVAVKPSHCAKLLQAIQVDDYIYSTVQLPKTLDLDYKRADFERFYTLNFGLWQSDRYLVRLNLYAKKIVGGDSLSADELTDYKLIRARLKQIRFAYLLFGEDHKEPKLTNKVTVAMGRLQDAIKNNQATKIQPPIQPTIRYRARELLGLLTINNMVDIAAEMRDFQAGSGKSFRAFLEDDLDFLEKGLERFDEGRVTGEMFHKMRKVVSRLAALFVTIDTLEPATSAHKSKTQMTLKFLGTLNGLMGNEHNWLIAATFDDDEAYENAAVQVANAYLISPMLHRLVRVFRDSLERAE